MPDGTVTAPGQKYDALPAYVEAAPKSQPFAEEARQRRLAPLDALVDAGLMKKAPAEIKQENMFGGAEKNMAVIAYDFTDKGRGAFKEDAGQSVMGGRRSGLCYGKPHVDEITNFTQPADMMGMTLSQVSYTYHLEDLPDWATNPKVKAAFPDVARNTAQSLEAKATVVLTNDGWKHEKAI